MDAADSQDLKLLSIAHYVLAALTAAMAMVFAPLGVVGWLWLHQAKQAAIEPPAALLESGDRALLGALYLATGASGAVLCLVHGVVVAYIGRCIARRRRRTLCLAFSLFHLLNLPLGTILSIFTWLVLKRPGVRQAFVPQQRPQTS
jgi:hypothetical protein